jgi:hypothetical protein
MIMKKSFLVVLVLLLSFTFTVAVIDSDAGVSDTSSIRTQSTQQLPALNVPYNEPVFGTSIRRISDSTRGFEIFNPGELGPDDPLRIVFDHERHEYSQHQAFNSDNSLIIMSTSADPNNYLVRDVETLNVVWTFPAFGAGVNPASVVDALRWNPLNPNEIIHFNNQLTNRQVDLGYNVEPVVILKTNVRAGNTNDQNVRVSATQIIADLSQAPNNYYWANGGRSRSYESLSRDGKYLALFVRKGADVNSPMYFVVYDIINNLVALELRQDQLDPGNQDCANNEGAINWVAVSPLGNYMVVQWNAAADETSAGRCTGVETYSLSTRQYSGHIGRSPAHSDLGIDHQGNEIYVTNYNANTPEGVSTGMLTVMPLPGVNNFMAVTNDGGINTGIGLRSILDTIGDFHVTHLSCKGPNGVCVITSDYNFERFTPISGNEPFDSEVYLVYTRGTASPGDNSRVVVQRLVHHRSIGCEDNSGAPLVNRLNYVDGLYNYRAQPQATISRNGDLVVFASNFGSCDNGAEDYLLDVSVPGADVPNEQSDQPNTRQLNDNQQQNQQPNDNQQSTNSGDVDLNNILNLDDVFTIINSIIGRTTLTGTALGNANVCGATQPGVRDLIAIINAIISNSAPQCMQQQTNLPSNNNQDPVINSINGVDVRSGNVPQLVVENGAVIDIPIASVGVGTLTFDITNYATFAGGFEYLFSWVPNNVGSGMLTRTLRFTTVLNDGSNIGVVGVPDIITVRVSDGTNEDMKQISILVVEPGNERDNQPLTNDQASNAADNQGTTPNNLNTPAAGTMSFFVTSDRVEVNRVPVQGGDFGGLAGADAFCDLLGDEALAAQNLQGKTWKAYLSTSTVDARDRIGTGPWYNANGDLVASNVGDLHDTNWNSRAQILTQFGDFVFGAQHDVITGSNRQGRKFVVGSDEYNRVFDEWAGSLKAPQNIGLYCNDWTSNLPNLRTVTGHSDWVGGINDNPGIDDDYWNSDHVTGCDAARMQADQGDIRIYCFAE